MSLFQMVIGNQKKRDGAGNGEKYRKNFFTTIRLIDEKEEKKEKNKYRFFIDKNDSVIFACTDRGGYGIIIGNRKRLPQYDKGNTINQLLTLKSHYREIEQNDLKQYFSPDEIRKISMELKISVEKIEITELQKNDIIQILKSSRAFNEDSAMEMTDKQSLCYQLAEEGILNAENDRFYIKMPAIT